MPKATEGHEKVWGCAGGPNGMQDGRRVGGLSHTALSILSFFLKIDC